MYLSPSIVLHLIYLRQGLWLNPELASSARLSDVPLLGSTPSHPYSAELQGHASAPYFLCNGLGGAGV